jgi:hypothetical protein
MFLSFHPLFSKWEGVREGGIKYCIGNWWHRCLDTMKLPSKWSTSSTLSSQGSRLVVHFFLTLHTWGSTVGYNSSNPPRMITNAYSKFK